MKNILMCFLFLFIGLTNYGQENSFIAGQDYFEGEAILKIKSKYASFCLNERVMIKEIAEFLESNDIVAEKMFPNKTSLNEKTHKKGFVDLSTIYKLNFNKETDVLKINSAIKKFESVQYIEPNFINRLTFDPSDPLNNQQWYLDAVDLYNAWDIEKGDTNVVIGIVDAGSDMDHPDMINNYALNRNDPINGIDDDQDGFIDNFNGWDVANNDNDPNLSLSGHGINVAGIASAGTDNLIGISGCGYNSRLLIVRIDDERTAQLTAAYQGIVYAADHGAFIISNSWGSHAYSEFAQEIVNYAAINQGALVIAATGNDGAERRFYPAAYDNVLAVGSTIEGDTVKATSNYGYWTDIFAPGENMLTTNAIGGYGINGGTSMAAPVVAGIASLVKSKYPNYTAKQVAEQLLNSADNIEALNDARYSGKIGSGRVNAFQALNNTNKPGIEFQNIAVTDNGDNQFLPGETIQISGDFFNHLDNARNVSVEIVELSNNLNPLQTNLLFGELLSGQFKSNTQNPFLFRLKEISGFNQRVEIEVRISADNYFKKQRFSFFVNSNYITIKENDLEVSLTANGRMGYSDASNELGVGLRYLDGNSILFEGGFAIGNSPNYLANTFRSDQGTDNDFMIADNIEIVETSQSALKTTTMFNDLPISNTEQLAIINNNYFYNQDNLKSTIITTYGIKNSSGNDLNELYGGLIMDWDIWNFASNKVGYDSKRKMGISFATDTNLYCGIKLLTENVKAIHYAIDNTSGAQDGVNLIDGFTDQEKYLVLSTNRDSAGTINPGGNDIIDVNSVGPFNLEQNEIQSISYAIIIANSLKELEESADTAQAYYHRFSLGSVTFSTPTFSNNVLVFPNPVANSLNLNLNLRHDQLLDFQIYDMQGRLVWEISNRLYSRGNHLVSEELNSLKSGVYLLQINGQNLEFKNKFVLSR